VSEELPFSQTKKYDVSNVLISDKELEGTERYKDFSYEKYRHIEECLRPYETYMK
jgi:hypothetical protein